MNLRPAGPSDIAGIAQLHAESWRRTYRGAFSDEFLDGPVFDERLQTWAARLTKPDTNAFTVVADDGGAIVGFTHVIVDDDATFGSLLDNLHVVPDRKGNGIGTRLLDESIRLAAEHGALDTLYLWVLEQNTNARAFYDARGGTLVERAIHPEPGGGTVVSLRYIWSTTSDARPAS